MSKTIIEGYWYNLLEPQYPMPVSQANPISKEFTDKLSYIENNKARKRAYKGISQCRICKCNNGSEEYNYKNYVWPKGYMHYLIQHNVHPSKNFYDFIMAN